MSAKRAASAASELHGQWPVWAVRRVNDTVELKSKTPLQLRNLHLDLKVTCSTKQKIGDAQLDRIYFFRHGVPIEVGPNEPMIPCAVRFIF